MGVVINAENVGNVVILLFFRGSVVFTQVPMTIMAKYGKSMLCIDNSEEGIHYYIILVGGGQGEGVNDYPFSIR